MIIDLATLERWIESLGWSSFGIIPIEEVRAALAKHELIFEKWLSKGFQADMEYLQIMQKDRYHPENKLVGVKSVIVLQACYDAVGVPVKDGGKGIVARYAMGRDYHKILKKRLASLSDWLRKQDPEIRTYASVDSGPTVDRVLAEAAGLGFFGKNTNLIDPSKGSYFFIACLLVNKALMPTAKRHMPTCGDCRECLKACPTGALVTPYTLDARRCIAYLTIENKEGILLEHRSAIGSRLFGCDACQEVCPFNLGRAGKQEIRIDELKASNGVGDCLDLREILSLESEEVFKERFAGTPLMRAGRRGLLRNACVVAGNIGEEALIPLLEALIEREADSMLCEHAKWAIAEIEKRSKEPPVKPVDG